MSHAPTANVEQQLRELTDLISLPEVYLKFRRLMDDPASEIDDFAEIIKLDPNLSIAVLKLVNSAYFGFSKKVDSVSQAINLIGIAQLHSMVLALSAISSLKTPNNIVTLEVFWRCSLFGAVLSRLLAHKLNIRQSERLFVMGLLHEIGHLVMYTHFPDQSMQSLRIVADEGLTLYEAEQRTLGCHYGDIGAMLMDHWSLSSDFQKATRYQPIPQAASDNLIEINLLHIAHAYAHQEIADQNLSAEQLITSIAWDNTGLSTEDIDDILETAHTMTADMAQVIKG